MMKIVSTLKIYLTVMQGDDLLVYNNICSSNWAYLCNIWHYKPQDDLELSGGGLPTS